MRKIIPSPIIALLSEIMPERESHATLDSLFLYADVPGEVPSGSKPVKVQEWLRSINKDESLDPLEILGKLIEGYMEEVIEEETFFSSDENVNKKKKKDILRIKKALERANLKYVNGGFISGSLGTPSVSLRDSIKNRNYDILNEEFERALKSINANPKEALSSACNIIESVCKVYIEEEQLEMPKKKDLRTLWNIVRKDLGFDPAILEDQDLKLILTGLISTVQGIGSLRTHASSAHGSGQNSYKIEPRHARLGVHSAHTVVLFVLESWDKKKSHG